MATDFNLSTGLLLVAAFFFFCTVCLNPVVQNCNSYIIADKDFKCTLQHRLDLLLYYAFCWITLFMNWCLFYIFGPIYVMYTAF